ncbi:peptide chain release factor N(5)-glutamine methyltransferase [Trichothermofontia sp.]
MEEARTYPVTGMELWQWRLQAMAAAIAADISPWEVDWLLQAVAPTIDGLALRLGTLADQPAVHLALSLAQLKDLWQQRLTVRVPIQYLVGSTHWRDWQLAVSPAVLIPRPETELIVDLAIAAVQASPHRTSLVQGAWADLGTGSGAIALGLAMAFPQAQIYAVDVSAAALAIAEHNIARYQLQSRIQTYQGTWFEPLTPLCGQLAGMVANPPYIPTALIPTLQLEVAQHEPHLALDGGTDGLEEVRHLIQRAPVYLRAGGVWLVELMAGQAAIVAEALQQQGHYENIQIHRDLAGHDRFVLAYRAG